MAGVYLMMILIHPTGMLIIDLQCNAFLSQYSVELDPARPTPLLYPLSTIEITDMMTLISCQNLHAIL